MTGTYVGCETSQCGACVIHLDGKSVKACTMLAVQADGAQVTTIEAFAKNGELHPMQAAFRAHAPVQCGFPPRAAMSVTTPPIRRRRPGVRERRRPRRGTGDQTVAAAPPAPWRKVVGTDMADGWRLGHAQETQRSSPAAELDDDINRLGQADAVFAAGSSPRQDQCD